MEKLLRAKADICSGYKAVDGIKVYTLKTSVKYKDEANRVQVVTIGEPNDRPIKSVLLLGQTGAGKTTIVNGLANYVFNVTFADDFRLKIIDQKTDKDRKETESQTDCLTAFIMYHHEEMIWGNSLMIIDTPGLGDPNQDAQQKINLNDQLKLFFDINEIDDLHCIGLVAKENETRVLDSHKEIFGEIRNLLGNKVPDITHLLASWGSANDPNVGKVVRDAGITFGEMIKLENGVYIASQKRGREEELQAVWKRVNLQYAKFVELLTKARPLSIKLLRERRFANESESALETPIKELAKMKIKMEKHKKILRENELKEAHNANFSQERKERRTDRKVTEKGYHAHNCKVCDKTCIFQCSSRSENGVADASGTAVGTYGIIWGAGRLASLVTADEISVLSGPIGTAVGATAVVATGLGSYFLGSRNAKCPLPTEKGVCSRCPHKHSEHRLEKEFIKVRYETKVDIDEEARHRYEVARYKKLEAKTLIDIMEKKSCDCKNDVIHNFQEMLLHIKNVGTLSNDTEIINPLENLEIKIRSGDSAYISYAIDVIKVLRRAPTKLDASQAEEPSNVISDLLNNWFAW